MPSTFTSRLKIERQASGENSGNWGNLTNFVFNRLDSSIRGYQAVSVAGSANVTLTSNNSTTNTDDSTTDDQVHNAVLEFTGALTGNIQVFTDAVESQYTLFNNTSGSFTLTFSNTGHAANGVSITQGSKSLVYSDGSQMYDVMKDLGNISANFITSNANIVATNVVASANVTGTNVVASANVTGTNLIATSNTINIQGTVPNVAATGGTNTDLLITPNGYGLVTFNGGGKLQEVVETVNTSATAATGTINYDLINGAIQNFTSNASANWTVNFRGNSSVSLDTFLDSGESATAVLIVPQGATAFFSNTTQIDGSTRTSLYQGGSAPTAGNASSRDVYSYTIIKTSANTYTTLVSQTQFKA